MAYRKGQQIECPHCGKDSLVTVKTEMDGWTKLGEIFACALCGAKLGDVGAETGTAAADEDGGAVAKLENFLGTTAAKVKEVIEDDGERRFCRDCKHFVEHPFEMRCIFHNRNVSPMDDCEHFERKKPR